MPRSSTIRTEIVEVAIPSAGTTLGLAFTEDNGYKEARWWSADGWQWRQENHIEHPEQWLKNHDGQCNGDRKSYAFQSKKNGRNQNGQENSQQKQICANLTDQVDESVTDEVTYHTAGTGG